ncbi:MAG: hypothetical protein FD149_1487 [Rhodospirillaceae bacterium]|nr:MAG: hypothetical protein FD149_1487 [Rhodospirillaceae bacterium]
MEMLAEAYRNTNDSQMAIDVLRRVVALKPFDAGSSVRLAALLQAKGEYEAAVSLLEETSRRHPRHPAVWLALGHLALDRNTPEGAIRALEHLDKLPDAGPVRANGSRPFWRSIRENSRKPPMDWTRCWPQRPMRRFCRPSRTRACVPAGASRPLPGCVP